MSQTNITVHKNRVKVYPGNTIYLKDKQEFEIELFNSGPNTRLAKIAINGTMISNSGLVIRPGQRVYLERYIDTPSKFKFDTYVVEAGNKEVEKAIQNNGIVQVYWYDEQTPPPSIVYTTKTITNPWFYSGGSFTTGNPGLQQQYFCSTSNLRGFSGAAGQKVSTGGSGCSTDWMEQMASLSEEEVSDVSQLAKKETGRVEAGGYSQQSFTNYSGKFNSWTIATNTIKILPYSTRPLEAKDLAAYCVECGTKMKKQWKHCPTCGTKY